MDEGTGSPERPNQIAGSLKRDVSDYRDYEIAHEKSPRQIRGTVYDETGQTRIMSNRLYPKEGDRQTASKQLLELMKDIDAYIAAIIEFVQRNHVRTGRDLNSKVSLLKTPSVDRSSGKLSCDTQISPPKVSRIARKVMKSRANILN